MTSLALSEVSWGGGETNRKHEKGFTGYEHIKKGKDYTNQEIPPPSLFEGEQCMRFVYIYK